MKVNWTVEGADNWSETITEDISCPPMEIATKVVERVLQSNNEYDYKLGLILMVKHDQMQSIDETYVCHTPTVLANAGFHKQARELQDLIDKLLKNSP
jgi:hypothetical protein